MTDRPGPIVLTSFDGGMLTHTPPAALGPRMFERLENCDTFRQPGTISTRLGLDIKAPVSASAAVLSVTPDFTDPIKAIGVYQRATTNTAPLAFGTGAAKEQLIATASRNTSGRSHVRVYRDSDNTMLADHLIAAGLNEGPGYVQFINGPLDRLYTNMRAGEGPWYLSGTSFIRAGFPAPTTAPTVAVGGAGVLTGAYRYVVTFLRGSLAAESSSGPQSATVNPVAQIVNLTAIPLVPVNQYAAGTGRIIYRTLASDFSRFYFVGILNDNVTTIFADNIPDSDIGPELSPDDNNEPPTDTEFMLWHKERMYYSALGILHFSAAAGNEIGPGIETGIHGAHAEIVPRDFQIPVGDTSDPIRGLAVLHDRVIIFKRNEIWQLLGSSPDDFVLDLVDPRVGILAPGSLVALPDRLLFLGQEDSARFYEFDGGRARPISLGVDEIIETEGNLTLIYEKDNIGGDRVPAAARTVGGLFDFYAVWSVPKAGESLPSGNGQGIPRRRFFMFYNYLTRAWSLGTNSNLNGIRVSAMVSATSSGSGSLDLFMASSSGNMGWVYRFGRVVNDQLEAPWTDSGGGNFVKGASVVELILPTIRFGPIHLGIHHRKKILKWIHAVVARDPADEVTLTMRRRWDEESVVGIPTARAEAFGNVARVTTGGGAQDFTAGKRLSTVRWDGHGGNYSGEEPDIGWEFQPILAGNKPFTLYSLAVYLEAVEEPR